MNEVQQLGYRGYITSRPYPGLGNARIAQHIQNLVVRDYCKRNGMQYLLSVVEHTMPGCYMILKQLINELPRLEGCVLYSIFQLPDKPILRKEIYDVVLTTGKGLYAAVENIQIRNKCDIDRVEDLWQIQSILIKYHMI